MSNSVWRSVTGRATGAGHIKAGIPCQDAAGYELVGTEFVIAALCDGAGSASQAEHAAKLAVDIFLDGIRSGVELGASANLEELLRRSALDARARLLAESEEEGIPPREFASTLLGVIIGPNGGAALQLGDGVIVVSEDGQGKEWSWVFWPQKGEYANTTFFLTDETAEEALQTCTFSSMVTDVALLSDGLESLALQWTNRIVHEPFFVGLFAPFVATPNHGLAHFGAQLQEFLASERVTNRTDDDASIIMITRRG